MSRPDNADLGELLLLESERATGHRQRALKRASRGAFWWTEEAFDLVAQGRSLTELPSVGPFLAGVIGEWIRDEAVPSDVPPIRRDFLTIAAARRILRAGTLPVRGDLQMHTTWSDGGSPLEEMAAAASGRGYEYIAVTDHSAGLKVVRGLDEDALERQGAEIDAWNASGSGVRVLKSVEMNLSPDGEGDVDPSALAKLDITLGSFHSKLRLKDDQTERYLAAVRNPHVNVLAHPRGRMYNFRIGLSADWPRVFEAAAEHGTAVEIDAFPNRQDLNVELLEIARETEVRISIGTDAHHSPQLEWIELGVAAAIRAKIPPERILNCMPLDDLLAWARP